MTETVCGSNAAARRDTWRMTDPGGGGHGSRPRSSRRFHIWRHMRATDIAVFALAAEMREVHVPVRRISPAPIRYIGMPSIVPTKMRSRT
jgi:hypothetical protein